MTVVVVSTGRSGAIGRGGGRDLEDAGTLFAGDFAGPKVRVLLQVAFSAGADPATVIEEEG